LFPLGRLVGCFAAPAETDSAYMFTPCQQQYLNYLWYCAVLVFWSTGRVCVHNGERSCREAKSQPTMGQYIDK
jgi:hypothetical protein